jgi:hypothetical protein
MSGRPSCGGGELAQGRRRLIVLETPRGRGADLRAADGQEIAGRDAQETRERRQVLDLEVEAAVEEPPQAPVAQPRNSLNVAAQKPDAWAARARIWRNERRSSLSIGFPGPVAAKGDLKNKSGKLLKKTGPRQASWDLPPVNGTHSLEKGSGQLLRDL